MGFVGNAASDLCITGRQRMFGELMRDRFGNVCLTAPNPKGWEMLAYVVLNLHPPGFELTALSKATVHIAASTPTATSLAPAREPCKTFMFGLTTNAESHAPESKQWQST